MEISSSRTIIIKWIDKNTIKTATHSNYKNAKEEKCDSITFTGPHIYIKNGVHFFIDCSKTYQYEENVELTTLCTKPQINLYIKDIKNYKSIAEIGVRYGSSSKYILDNNKNLDHLDLYEINENFINITKERLKDYSGWKLYVGDAKNSLQSNDTYYDLVFFDCSHIYDIDIEIFNSLLSHIDDNTVIVFDDYYVADVKHLVKDAQKLLPNNTIIYEQKGRR